MLLRRVLGNARRVLRPDDATRRFIRHNRRVWPTPPRRRSGPIVMIDAYSISQSALAYSYMANALARRHQARIVVFGIQPVLRRLDMYLLFRSFGARGHVRPTLRGADAERVQAESRALLAGLRTKRDLLELVVDGIGLGEDVYESYLRRFSAATVDLADPRLADLLAETVGYLRFWQRHLDRHDVRAIVVSEDCYVENNIFLRLAYQRGIPAYMPHVYRIVRLDRPHSPYQAFPHYRELFAALPAETQERGLALAAQRIGQRISGDKSIIEIHFTDVNAFSLPETGERVLRESDRLKVLICTHCFFDNPHVYGGMLFEDFWEWLSHLGRLAATTDHDWYIKTHPRPLPGTHEIIDRLLEEFPHLTLVPSDVSHHQLIHEGIDVVLTCYGSVGEEYPLLGVGVLTAGYHPRAAYDFNHKAATLEEYDEKLRSLPLLVKPDVDPNDVHEFYFMHHIAAFDDDLILDSYEAFVEGRTWEQTLDSSIYDHFLDGWDERRHAEIVATYDAFLASGLRYQYRYGPVGLPGDQPAVAAAERR